jgi:pseudouridine-5'-phosphate glycosidase
MIKASNSRNADLVETLVIRRTSAATVPVTMICARSVRIELFALLRRRFELIHGRLLNANVALALNDAGLSNTIVLALYARRRGVV